MSCVYEDRDRERGGDSDAEGNYFGMAALGTSLRAGGYRWPEEYREEAGVVEVEKRQLPANVLAHVRAWLEAAGDDGDEGRALAMQALKAAGEPDHRRANGTWVHVVLIDVRGLNYLRRYKPDLLAGLRSPFGRQMLDRFLR